MRLVRLFSTTFRRPAQPLFQPYVAPLNKEQQKALRLEVLRKQPHYHGRLSQDAHSVLMAFKPLNPTDENSPPDLHQMNEVIGKIAGPDISVVDIGMSQYAVNLHNTPREFAIVDNKRPAGIRPDEKSRNLPLVYDPSLLARQLIENGFSGAFVNHPIDLDVVIPDSFLPPPPRRELSIPFPDYKCIAEWGLVPPAQLRLDSPVECTLTLPGPTTALRDFITMCCSLSALRMIIGHLYIWTRSLQMYEFTPTCLALMCIRYLQESGQIPDLFDAEATESAFKGREKPGFWHPLQLHDRKSLKLLWTTKPIWLETAYVPYRGEGKRSKKIGPLLFNFFRYWSTATTRAKREIVSVRENSYAKRELLFTATRDRTSENFMRSTEKDIWKRETLDKQPASWKFQQFIVQDPFIPTFNHAASVSRATMRYFEYNCSLAARSLSHGHAFHNILGAHFMPPRRHPNLEKKLQTLGIKLPSQRQTWDQELSESSTSKSEYSTGSTVDGVDDDDRADVPRYQKQEWRTRPLQSGRRVEKNEPIPFGLKSTRRYHTSAVLPQGIQGLRQLLQPPQHVLDRRAQTIRRVRDTIRKRYGTEYGVESFGSTAYGVSSYNSDLDLVIIDSERMHGFEPRTKASPLPAIYNILKLGNTLRWAGFRVIQTISSARVPIVKFRDPKTGLNCDINVNEQLGLMNTMMLKHYCDISPHLRFLIAFIKTWAKPLGLNNPSGDPTTRGIPVTFSSYAFALMSIGFLQSRGLLPNLQEGLRELDETEKEGAFWCKLDGTSSTKCDIRYHKAEGWTPSLDIAVDDLILEYFRYWAEEHSFDDTLLDIRRGGFLPRQKPHNSRAGIQLLQILNSRAPMATKPTAEERESIVVNRGDIAAELWVREKGGHDNVVDGFDQIPGGPTRNPVKEPVTLNNDVPTLDPDGEPHKWLTNPVCIVDPFIRHKNVTQNVGRPSVRLFQLRCARAVSLLVSGESLRDVIEDAREHQPQRVNGEKWEKDRHDGKKPTNGWDVPRRKIYF